MSTSVLVMPLDVLVDLVNGWGTQPRAEAGEEQQAYPSLPDLLDRAHLPDEVAATATDAGVVGVADRLYPVFAATEDAVRAARVTELLAATEVRPTLEAVDGAPRAGWLVREPRSAMLAAAAIALRAQLIDHAADRLGTCAGRRCADVYIDGSPGGDRRFCSITCQTRTRVAAFRQRKNSTG